MTSEELDEEQVAIVKDALKYPQILEGSVGKRMPPRSKPGVNSIAASSVRTGDRITESSHVERIGPPVGRCLGCRHNFANGPCGGCGAVDDGTTA